MKLLLKAFISLIIILLVFNFPKIYQPFSIKSSIAKIENRLEHEKPFTPEYGYTINFKNGEWLIIDLHHGSAGYTIAYDSNKQISVITDYSTIYPAYEVWGSICNKEYESINEFYNLNKSLNWKKYY